MPDTRVIVTTTLGLFDGTSNDHEQFTCATPSHRSSNAALLQVSSPGVPPHAIPAEKNRVERHVLDQTILFLLGLIGLAQNCELVVCFERDTHVPFLHKLTLTVIPN